MPLFSIVPRCRGLRLQLEPRRRATTSRHRDWLVIDSVIARRSKRGVVGRRGGHVDVFWSMKVRTVKTHA